MEQWSGNQEEGLSQVKCLCGEELCEFLVCKESGQEIPVGRRCMEWWKKVDPLVYIGSL